jgi:hypothetical protein
MESQPVVEDAAEPNRTPRQLRVFNARGKKPKNSQYPLSAFSIFTFPAKLR